MDSAPPTMPATPARRSVAKLVVPPPTPIIRAAVETSPSFAPKTRARSQGARLLWCLQPPVGRVRPGSGAVADAKGASMGAWPAPGKGLGTDATSRSALLVIAELLLFLLNLCRDALRRAQVLQLIVGAAAAATVQAAMRRGADQLPPGLQIK